MAPTTAPPAPDAPDDQPWTPNEIAAAKLANIIEDADAVMRRFGLTLAELVNAECEAIARAQAAAQQQAETRRRRFALLRKALRDGTVK